MNIKSITVSASVSFSQTDEARQEAVLDALLLSFDEVTVSFQREADGTYLCYLDQLPHTVGPMETIFHTNKGDKKFADLKAEVDELQPGMFKPIVLVAPGV